MAKFFYVLFDLSFHFSHSNFQSLRTNSHVPQDHTNFRCATQTQIQQVTFWRKGARSQNGWPADSPLWQVAPLDYNSQQALSKLLEVGKSQDFFFFFLVMGIKPR